MIWLQPLEVKALPEVHVIHTHSHFLFWCRIEGLFMDGIQVGHYLDNVFAFSAELSLKIGLQKTEAGVLLSQWEVWELRRGSWLRT